MEERILFVDDDSNILEAYQRKLQHVMRVRTALGPHAGLREIQEKGPFAVVVADMNMPLMNGVEFLKRVRDLTPNTVRMMLTGNPDIRVAMDAVNEGNVFRFLMKPCPSNLMAESLMAAIRQYRLVTAERELIEGTLKGTAELLTEILSWTSPHVFGRTVQLRNAATKLAARVKAEDPWEIELAATLSQIGVLAIPTEILAKVSGGESLTHEEQDALEAVPAIGHELLKRIPRLDKVAEIVLYQNKRFDGTGFPDTQVAGTALPMGSRILKAVSDYHELRAAGKSRHESVAEMRSRQGWYDPAVLDAVGLDPPAAPAPTESQPRVAIPLSELQPGLTLAEPILTATGCKLIDARTTISEALLIRLKKYAETNQVRGTVEVFLHS